MSAVTALEDNRATPILLNDHAASTYATRHTTAQDVSGMPYAFTSLTMGGMPLLLGDDRLVATREPLFVMEHFAKVNARIKDRADGRVFDPRPVFDESVTFIFSSQSKNLLNSRGIRVRN